MLNQTFDEIDDISPQELPDKNHDKSPEKHVQVVKQISPRKIVVNDMPEVEFKLQYPVGVMKVKILDNSKFLFHDYNNIFIGQYTANDIINYILENVYDAHSSNPNIYTNNIDASTRKLIELTICKASKGEYIFRLNTTSPFMNDIDLLMILNKIFKNFETHQINKFIPENSAVGQSHLGVPIHDDKSLKVIRSFIYSLIEHTINIISVISKQLKDGCDETLKNKLMRYSIGLVYKMTQYLNSEITSSELKYKSMLSSVEMLSKVENKMENELINFCNKK